jgi:hypothetical protein
VRLVTTSAQASASRKRLWKGDRQKELDRILAILDSLQIPSHYKEIVNSTTRLTILGITIGTRRSTFEYEVWVLHSDFDRAKSGIGENAENDLVR